MRWLWKETVRNGVFVLALTLMSVDHCIVDEIECFGVQRREFYVYLTRSYACCGELVGDYTSLPVIDLATATL